MPANPMIDQKQVGAALEGIGAGVLLPKRAKPQRIRAAVETVLQDPGYGQAANRLGEQIRQRDGADVAAVAIQDFLETLRANAARA